MFHIHWAPETFLGSQPAPLAGTEPLVLVFPSLQEARGKHLLSADTTHQQLKLT